jgi:hypothetical protein
VLKGTQMLELKTLDDIARARAEGRAAPALTKLVAERLLAVQAAFREGGAEWDPDEHGHWVVIEAGDDVRDLRAQGLNPEDHGLLGAVWEAVEWHPAARLWEVFIVYSGDAGMTFLVLDGPWLDAELRRKLKEETEAPAPVGQGTEQTPF